MLVSTASPRSSSPELNDPASLSFGPLIDLQENAHANLTAQTVTYWLKHGRADSWGPAMLLYRPFRFLLLRGGLPITRNLSDFLVAYPQWKKSFAELEITDPLYLARLYLYLGFHDPSAQILAKLIRGEASIEIKGWAHFLLAQISRTADPTRWETAPLERFVEERHDELSPRMRFNATILLASRYCTEGGLDRCRAQEFLSAGRLLIDNEQIFREGTIDRAIAESRWARYQSVHLLNQRKFAVQRRFLNEQIMRLEDFLDSRLVRRDEGTKFLAAEGLRRLLDHQTLALAGQGRPKEAASSARRAVEIDPNCPRALMMAGETCLHASSRSKAFDYFHRSRLRGVLERPYCDLVLSQQYSQPSAGFEASLIDMVDGDFYFSKASVNEARRRLRSMSGRPSSPTTYRALNTWLSELCSRQKRGNPSGADIGSAKFPVFIRQYEGLLTKLTDTDSAPEEGYLDRSEAYQRFLPYWELRAPRVRTPDIGLAPWVAWNSWKTQAEPWFKSVALQRIPMSDFRENLYYACVKNSKVSQDTARRMTAVEGMLNRSPEADEFLTTLQNAHSLNPLQRATFARVAGNLGFIREAVNLCPIPEIHRRMGAAEYYQINTAILYRVLLRNSPGIAIDSLMFEAFHEAPRCDETLRSRLSIALIACIHYGQRLIFGEPIDLKIIEEWRTRAQAVLADILECPSFSDFDKNLLHSRFYRGVTYVPYMSGETGRLRYEANLCEKYARAAVPHTEFEKLLYRDNLYSMLDSMQRIHVKLGDSDRALSMFKEITEYVDPMDCRFWLGQGVLHEQRKELREAAECYVTSGRLAVAVGRVAWFKAGKVYERLGELSEARKCHFRSLALWPNGIAPLEALVGIGKKTNDTYLKTWAEKQLLQYVHLR